MAENYSADHNYEAWGTVPGVGNFCCSTSVSQSGVDIIGSAYADTIRAYDATLGVHLQPTGSTTLSLTVTGAAGNDVIHGSDSYDGDYDEELNGGPNDDTIIGHDGDDHVNGESGDDILHGGTGLDQMDGGTGSDTMLGGDGYDYMYGGDGVDFMGGGPGDDYMNGQGDADWVCGDGYAYGDTLIDGGVPTSGVDKLWGTSSGGLDTCQNAATLWDGTATTSSSLPCSTGDAYHLFSRPSECPE